MATLTVIAAVIVFFGLIVGFMVMAAASTSGSGTQCATLLGTLSGTGTDLVVTKSVGLYNFNYHFTDYHACSIGDNFGVAWRGFLRSIGLATIIGTQVGTVDTTLTFTDSHGSVIDSQKWTDPTAAYFTIQHDVTVPGLHQGESYHVNVHDIWGDNHDWDVTP